MFSQDRSWGQPSTLGRQEVSQCRDGPAVLTFMTRITNKGWLEVEKEGNTNYYRPAVDEGHALEEGIRRYVDQVVGPEPENRELLKRILETY